MITLTLVDGRSTSVSPAAIAQVQEASVSQQWHNVRSNVQLMDGKWLEVQETRAWVLQRIEQETPHA